MYEQTQTLNGRLSMWGDAMDKQVMQGLPVRLKSDLHEAKARIEHLESVAAAATLLVAFIRDEGPAAVMWQPISHVTGELGKLLNIPTD